MLAVLVATASTILAALVSALSALTFLVVIFFFLWRIFLPWMSLLPVIINSVEGRFVGVGVVLSGICGVVIERSFVVQM